MLSDTQLDAFERRVKRAHFRGYLVAHGDLYAEKLSQEAGLKGYGGSAKDLMDLCAAVKAKRVGKPVKAEAKAPAPKAKPAPKPEPVPEEEEGYEAWTRDELYEEARDREIDGRSDMTKAELIEALEADDKLV